MSLFLIIYYIGKYRLFQKLGYKGFESFIPVYNQYLLCKKIDVSRIFMIIYLIISFLIELFIILITCYVFIFMIIVPILRLFIFVGTLDILKFNKLLLELYTYSIILIIYMIMRFIVYFKISMSFNNDFFKSICLGFFNYIGVIFIGFDDSKYIS